MAPDNPKHLLSLADLLHEGVSIVSRQRGSGSRVEFDQLLSGAGIDAGKIDGYLTEEFTRVAFAATIATGRADAGYGVRAAAAEYGPGFIPLLTERYFLACRTDLLADPSIVEFLALLRGDEFRKILAKRPRRTTCAGA